jgi:hypothetical protein
MTTWKLNNTGPIKAIVCRASDIKRGRLKVSHIELTDLNSLRLLMMHVEDPLIIAFASEENAPAELEIMVYDEPIEIQN